MQAKVGEPRQIIYSSGTYDSLLLTSYMVAAVANTALAQSDFLPQNVSIKILYRHANKTDVIMMDNLLILGTFCTLTNSYHEFLNGIDVVYPSAGVKAQKLRTAKLDFGGVIRVSPGDSLIVEVSPSQVGTFTAAVDAGTSYIEFDCLPAIGYATSVPMIKSEVIQASTNKQEFNVGDNITRLAILNFDQNNLTSSVVNNLSLMSDRLDISLTFNQLQGLNAANFVALPAYRFGTALPIVPVPTVSRGLNYLPQSYILFDGRIKEKEIDQVRLNIAFNGINVSASNNYIVYRTYEADANMLKESANRAQKHNVEFGQKIAATSMTPVVK